MRIKSTLVTLVTLVAASASAAWFDAPSVLKTVRLSEGAASPRFMNKSADDARLLVNLGDAGGPVLLEVAELADVGPAAPTVRRVAPRPSDFGAAGLRGGAVSSDLGLAIAGNPGADDFWAFATEGSTWVAGANLKSVAAGAPSDGLDFGTGSSYLYGNVPGAGGIVRWTVDASGALADRVTKATASGCIRNLSVHRVGSRELVFYGNGAAGTSSGALYVMDVTDADPANWTETALGVSLAGSVTNAKLSNEDSASPILYALAENGLLGIYRLAADGLSVSETIREVSLADLAGLAASDIGFNFEVTKDGKTAFLIGRPAAGGVTLAVLTTPGYLQSVTRQGLNTGYRMTAKTRVEIDFQLTTNAVLVGQKDNYQMRMFGMNGGGKYFQLYCGDNYENFKLGYGNSFNGVYLAPCDQARHTIVYDEPGNVCTFRTGGQTVATVALTAAHDVSAAWPLMLFSQSNRADGTGFDSWSYMRLYGCRIYEDGVLARDYVPCVKGGVAGVYDRVTGAFLTNAQITHTAAHDFVAGGDVLTLEDDAFVETDGQHAINSGVYLEPGMRIEADYAFIDWVDPYKDQEGAEFHYQQRLFGQNSQEPKTAVYVTSNGDLGFVIGDDWSVSYYSAVKPDTARHTIILDDATRKRHYVTCCTTNAVMTGATNVTKFASWPIAIGGTTINKEGTSFTDFSHVKFYGMRFLKNGVLLRDFVPRVVGGVAGLRDRITGAFVSCAGWTAGGNAAELASTDETTEDPCIESDGSAKSFMNTGFKVGCQSKVEVDFAFVSVTTVQQRVVGNDGYNSDRRHSLYINGSGQFALAHSSPGNANWTANVSTMADTLRHTVVLDFAGRRKSLVTAGVTNFTFSIAESHLTSGAATATQCPSVLFGAANATHGLSASSLAKVRIYGARYWEAGTLVRDFRPCVRAGVPGFRDAVSGTFITGEDVSTFTPHNVTDVDDGDPALVITGNDQSTGGRYLDTGYFYTDQTRVVVDYALSANYTATQSGNGDWYVVSGWSREITDAFATNDYHFCLCYNKSCVCGNVGTSNWPALSGFGAGTTGKGIRRLLTLDAPNKRMSIATAGYTNAVATFADVGVGTTARHSIRIGAWHNGGGYAPLKIYGVRIYEGEQLVRDYSPYAYGGQVRLRDAVAGGALEVKNYTTENVTASGAVPGTPAMRVIRRAGDAYIESDGTQAVNLGHYTKPSTRYEIDFQLMTIASQNRVFSAADGSLNAELYIQGGLTLAYGVGDTWNCQSTNKKADLNRHVGYLDVNNRAWFLSDYAAGAFLNVSCTRTDNRPMALFAKSGSKDAFSPSNKAKMRLYAFRIYESEQLIHEYLPYRLGSVVGLYDTVTGEILQNAATEANPFVYGGAGYGDRSDVNLALAVAPTDKSVLPGETATLTAYAPGAIRYDWMLNGEALCGVTEGELTVSWRRPAHGAAADAYTVTPIFLVAGEETPGASVTAHVTSEPRGFSIFIR